MRKLCSLLIFCAFIANAQNTNDDFRSFRERLLSDYQGFRTEVLDNYSNYLAGIWYEFQLFRGVKRDDTPKPAIVPNVDEIPANPNPQILPEPNVTPLEPVSPTVTPSIPPIAPVEPLHAPKLEFTFYGIKLQAVQIKTYLLNSLDSRAISSTWKKYSDTDNRNVCQSLLSLASSLGLNDWFTFELIRDYCDEMLKSSSPSDRVLLQHYLMTAIGYDVRLAKSDKQLLLMVPFKQIVYERSFITIDGKKYYAFFDKLSPINESSPSIYTCEIPKNENLGHSIDLMFCNTGMNIQSGSNKDFTITDGKIQLHGTVNVGLMEMLRHYPQMDVIYYAKSNVLPLFHQDILNQIKPQIEQLNKVDAAKALLHFVQFSFKYATDGNQHGYEKPYFIEENFYYPKNDCEDRAIFYAFLVRNLLGLDVQLVQYPGHECTAICFSDNTVRGDGYTYKGKKYIICDPTYIGASIGQCMPTYRSINPTIETWE